MSGALFVAAIADQRNPALFGSSALTFGFGAPIIHLAHRRWDTALGSFGLRLAGPLLGLAIGSMADTRRGADDASGSRADSSEKWATLGVAIGAVTASVLDGSLLAYDTRERPPETSRRGSLLASAVPRLTMQRRGLALGYALRF